MREWGKRGQATLFIIIAIIIVVGVVLALIFAPRFNSGNANVNTENPKAYIESCIADDLREDLELVGMNGGFLNPEGNLLYKGEEIKYLCYTNENYKPCVIQEPLLKSRIESELKNSLSGKVESCVQNFVQESRRKGNEISIGNIVSEIELNPRKINLIVNVPMTITNEVTRNYDVFDIEFESEMYDLAILVTSILSFESIYGDSEITDYLRYYPDLKIEKISAGDSNTIYIVSNVVTEEEIRFASRSLVFPAGGQG